MGRSKHRSQLDAIDEINMTPLIDLTFVLLIVFIITVPMMEFGVNVSPPEMTAEKLPEEDYKIVNLDDSGKIILDKAPVSREELIDKLKYIYSKNKKTAILIRADGSRPYKEVIELMKYIKEAGFSNVSLVTQADA
ncbi:MAG: hypothetical protein A2020_06360 [Lentisphaerae bacterium GWF2_45_14]|nr:MAG: hypothetical protein A2020_06360 [Lentisphaerae bacterium GWF2_45_14]